MDKEASFDKAKYDELAGEMRYVVTDMICRAGSGHLGGAISLIETVVTLYWRVMRVDPALPKWEGRDRLVLSKGHAAPILYACLAYRGFFPKARLKTLNADGASLPSHADERTVPGVDMTTGSLGQGLSAASGMALAAKKDGKRHHVFCIVGDGELNEGQNWEAAMFAPHNRLDNLICIVDYNKLQIDGFTWEVLDLEPLADKFRAFGWNVSEMDGHDWDDIYRKLTLAKKMDNGRPTAAIAHTVKARGCASVENTPGSHNIKVGDEKAWRGFLDSVTTGRYDLPY